MLRAIDEQDLGPMLLWRNQLTKYFREYRPLTVVDQARWFESLSDDKSQVMFAIWYDGRMVGCCGLNHIDWLNKSGEVSLYIGEPKVQDEPVYIDQKVAPLALDGLLSYGFKTLGLHRIWAETFDYDERKAALLKAAGFASEARLKDTYFKDGDFWASNIFSLLENEWQSAEK